MFLIQNIQVELLKIYCPRNYDEELSINLFDDLNKLKIKNVRIELDSSWCNNDGVKFFCSEFEERITQSVFFCDVSFLSIFHTKILIFGYETYKFKNNKL